jgi:hypothetical protein
VIRHCWGKEASGALPWVEMTGPGIPVALSLGVQLSELHVLSTHTLQ